MSDRAPQVGDLVLYKMSIADVEATNRRRLDFHRSRDQWVGGAQAHVGNSAEVGQVLPAVVVRTWGDTPGSAANLQVFLDGNDTYWVTSRVEGDDEGRWSFRD